MTELEILELALEGAKTRLDQAIHYYQLTRSSDSANIDEVKAALLTYDNIKGMIEKCKTEELE